jgi:superfamily II DNA or RNA helicase
MSIPVPAGQRPLKWQAEAAEAARFALYAPDGPGWQSGIVNAATGTGKGTFLAGIAVAHALRSGRVVIVVDRKKLVRDLAKRCREVAKAAGLVDKATGRPLVGVCMAAQNEMLNPIVVASIQTISQPDRLKALGKVSLLLTDEAHGATAPTHRAVHEAIAEAFPGWKHIGLTATGYRGDGTEGLGDVFDGVIYTYTIAQAVDAGDLVPIEDYGVDTEISIEDCPLTESGEYDEDELAKRVNVPARNRLAWRKYLEKAAGRPALFFAANVAHANELARMGREEFGVNAQAVHGDNPEFPLKERECDARIDRYMHPEKYAPAERVPVLCSCDLIRVGFDAPHTYCVLLARAWKSLVAFVQTVGRGTRLHPDTARALTGITDPATRRAAIAASPKPSMLFLQLVDSGCEMTLDTATNLESATDKETREVKPLEPGEEVQRRRHDEWGIGRLVSIREAPPLGRLGLVRWPPTETHPDGDEREHRLSDLKRASKKPHGEEIEPTAITVAGHQEYRLHLLPGQRAEDPGVIGWYEYEGTYTVGGVAPRIGRIKMHVREGAKGWEVWSLRPPIASRNEKGPDDIATCQRPDCAKREIAIAWANSHLQANGAIVAPLDAEWRSKPASSGQKYVLRVECQIRRDLDNMSAGEADALIDAVKAFRRINDVKDPGLANRRKWAQRQFRGGRRGAA